MSLISHLTWGGSSLPQIPESPSPPQSNTQKLRLCPRPGVTSACLCGNGSRSEAGEVTAVWRCLVVPVSAHFDDDRDPYVNGDLGWYVAW
jgi:hypothetical protein